MNQASANSILKKAWKKHQRTDEGQFDTISSISKKTKIPYSNCYNALHGKTKCNADTWVTLMRYFNHLKLD